jgi:hypothetical protein
MSIYRPNTMRTSTLRSAITFMQSSIYSSTYIKDMIVQLLKSHARAPMPPKGMWSKLMKLKNISTVAMYLHRKQRGASSSLICMSGFLPLSVYNTICPINKWCCLTMTMMCRKWQHGQPFPERCSQNGSKQTKNRKLHEALRSINSLSNGCGIEN